jgi:hypothetical protein
MIDTHVGDWINSNICHVPLQRFISIDFIVRNGKRERKNTTITDSDFGAYLKWADWCREKAGILSNKVPIKFGWRARDVEMAVFTAQKQELQLNLNP